MPGAPPDRAVPRRRFGKKRLVEGMKDEKFPPPKPARKASKSRTP